MYDEAIEEARRQAQICNSCRYCEGYCAVFPAMHINRAFSDGDLTQLANLLRIPEYPPTHSDNMRPLVPGYPPTRDALP